MLIPVLALKCMAQQPPGVPGGQKPEPQSKRLSNFFLDPAFIKEVETCRIENYTANDKAPNAVLDDLFKMFEGKLQYLKGYKLPDSANMKKINFTLRNADLSTALSYVAIETHLQMREIDGLMVYDDHKMSEWSVTAIPIKKETALKLKLTGPTPARETLQMIGVETNTVHFSVDNGVLIVKSTEEDIQILRSIIKLIERGYDPKIEKASN